MSIRRSLAALAVVLVAASAALSLSAGSATAAKPKTAKAAAWSHCGEATWGGNPTAYVTAVKTSCKRALTVEAWFDSPVRPSHTAPLGFHCQNKENWGSQTVCRHAGGQRVVIVWRSNGYAGGAGTECGASGQIATGQGIEYVRGLSCAQGKAVIGQLVTGHTVSGGLKCKVTTQGDASCTNKTGTRFLVGSAYTG